MDAIFNFKRQTDRQSDRYTWIDFVRLIAICMVIFNHTYQLEYSRGFYSFLYDELKSISFVLDFSLSNLCKCGVPLFFMISGVTVLKKEESIQRTLQRIPKIAIDLLLFSYGYFILDAVLARGKVSFFKITKEIIWGSYPHLWYLYAYISFLVSVPILRQFVWPCRVGGGWIYL